MVTCIDHRIQHHLEDWLRNNIGQKNYDRVALAGGVFDFYSVLRQIEISDRLHEIKKVIFVNHEDCGAYGQEGTKERHIQDLREAKRKLEVLFPHLQAETYYAHLDGTMETV